MQSHDVALMNMCLLLLGGELSSLLGGPASLAVILLLSPPVLPLITVKLRFPTPKPILNPCRRTYREASPLVTPGHLYIVVAPLRMSMCMSVDPYAYAPTPIHMRMSMDLRNWPCETVSLC